MDTVAQLLGMPSLFDGRVTMSQDHTLAALQLLAAQQHPRPS